MNNNFARKEINNGIYFNSIIDNRFKTNRMSVNFILPLSKETATVNALLPFVLRKGNKNYPNFTDFSAALEELYGASVSCDIQKLGDNQVLTLSISSIDDKFTFEKGNELTISLAKILSDIVLNPSIENDSFDDKEIEIEKNALIDTIEAEINEKRLYAINNTIKTMCEGEPYGVSKYGYKEDVSKITSKSAYDAYRKIICSARIEIMFTGCGDYNCANTVFVNSFANLKREFTHSNNTQTHIFTGEVKEKTENMAVTQSKMVIGLSSGLKSDSAQGAAARLMVCVLGGTPTSKLFLNVREKLSLCYYCAARYDKYKGLLLIDCGVENENISKAKDEIINQINAIKNGEITDKEISDSVLSLKNSLNSVGDSTSTIEGWYLGQIISETYTSPECEAQKLDTITKQDIIDVSNKFVLDTIYVLTSK